MRMGDAPAERVVGAGPLRTEHEGRPDVPDARVYEVKPGSLIVLRGVEYEGITLEELMDGIERACGHRRFLIMQIPEGSSAVVLGPDELVGWLREALGIDLDLAKTAPTPKEYDLGRVDFG
jgi:hypothetical protein